MTPEDLVSHVREATGLVERDELTPQGQAAVWVAPERWLEAATHLRTCGRCGFDFFTFLTAVDRGGDRGAEAPPPRGKPGRAQAPSPSVDQGEGLEVVCHVYAVRRQHHLNLKTLVPREGGSLATLSGVWRGANWHERETAEMFGIGFAGHPNLAKLELPVNFEGFPLRKDFLLITREAKEWPGQKEPEERHEEAKS
ncbi:MAG: NADH-quinone oxidoreductase subunit C [Acidobacteria bacterium]|nr:NADH-quinone oxidoreductase subunit C [Acidobacteriota bacterium]